MQNDQRQRRRDEQAANTAWEKRHFEHIPSDPVYERLAKLFNGAPPAEDTYVFQHNHAKTPSMRAA